MLTEQDSTTEIVEDYRGDAHSPHLAKVRGRFLREGAVSKAGRVYTNIGESLRRAQSRLDEGAILDMKLRHPSMDGSHQSVLEVVGKLTKVTPDGMYEGVVANTSGGRDMLSLLEGQYVRHVSLRGDPIKRSPVLESTLRNQGVRENIESFDLTGIDYTNRPNIADTSAALAEAEVTGGLYESFDLDELTEAMTAALRKKREEDGDTMAGGKYPIGNQKELDDAVRLIGQGNADESAIKAHIRKQAKKYGLKLPDSWNSNESASAEQLTEQERIMTIAEKIATALTEAGPAEPAEKVGFDPNSLLGKAINEAQEPEKDEEEPEAEEPADEAAEATESEPDGESQLVEAVLGFTTKLQEAGAMISSANKSKLKPAHDVVAELAGLPCGNATESSTVEGLSEAQVAEAVERGVKSALETQATAHQKQIEDMTNLHEAQLGEVVDAVRNLRRKSHAVLEAGTGAEKVAAMSRGERLRIMAEAKGHKLN